MHRVNEDGYANFEIQFIILPLVLVPPEPESGSAGLSLPPATVSSPREG